MEENIPPKEVEEYKLSDFYDISTRTHISTVVTSTDTIVIWSKYRYGSVIIERKSVKAE